MIIDMPGAVVRADAEEIADDVQFGEDVVIEARRIRIGRGCQIGVPDENAFRTPSGVRISVEWLDLGDGVRIGSAVAVRGGAIVLGDGVSVGRGTTINVTERLSVGAGGLIGEENDIAGRHIEIGQEMWSGPRARIGGGSAFENTSRLSAGHYFHLGLDAFVNTARAVEIGHEVGLGTRTSIYTHGAYPSRLQGFPVAFDGVSIGDFTWVPGATINPGVSIGRNCVIGVNSLVTSDIPDGSLAAGSPAKVIREGAYPRPLGDEALTGFYEAFLGTYAALAGRDDAVPRRTPGGVQLAMPDMVVYFGAPADDASTIAGPNARVLVLGSGWADHELPESWTAFDIAERRIAGMADGASSGLANELRRYGIRFYSRPNGDVYESWETNVPQHAGTHGPHENPRSATVRQ